MNKEISVAFLTSSDPYNKRSWSGIYFRMLDALKGEFVSVEALGPVPKYNLSYLLVLIRLLSTSIVHRLLYAKKFNNAHSPIRSKFYAQHFNKKLAGKNFDVIFAPSASIEIAHLKTDIPICYLTGATFAHMNEYYDFFSGLSDRSVQEGNEIEQAAVDISCTQVFPSTWAQDFARSRYGASDSFVVKHGANIDFVPDDHIKTIAQGDTLKILFIGVDWIRKGGDIVFQTLELLCERGVDVELTVCGCAAPVSHPKMEVLHFLDKNKKGEAKELHELYKRSHLFFMPTRAENFGVVFCEANAYGVPAISTSTGGTTSAIQDGENGYTLPMEAGALEYADLIQGIISDEQGYHQLSLNARKKYLEELNWGHWGKRMREILVQTSKS